MNPTIISTAGAIGTFAALSYAGASTLPRNLSKTIARPVSALIGESPLYMTGGVKSRPSARDPNVITYSSSSYNYQSVAIFAGLVAAGVLLGGVAQSGTQIRT